MPEGLEFLRAFARFFVDRSDFDRTLRSIESDAARTARAVEEGLKARAGATGPLGRSSEEAQRLELAFRRGAQAAAAFTTAHVEVSRTVKQVAQAAASELHPALSQALDALRNASQAGRAFGVGVGVMVGALTAVSVALGVFIRRLEASREAQIALNLAAGRFEFGAARGELERAEAELARIARLQEELEAAADRARRLGPLGALGGVPAFVERLLGPAVEEVEARVRQAQALARQAFVVFERPRAEAEARRAELEALREVTEAEGRRAETAAAVLGAAERQAALLRKQGELAARLASLEGLRQAIELRRLGLAGEAAQVEALAARRVAALQQAAAAQAEAAQRAALRRAAELEAVELETEVRRQERLGQRRRAEAQAAREALEIERQLEEARAQAQGRLARGLGAFQAERRQLLEEEVRQELDAIGRVAAARAAALRARLGAAEGAERVRLAAELGDVEAAAAEERRAVERRWAAERRRLDLQELRERQQAVAQELALERERFEHRLRMGRVTVEEELGRLLRLARDERLGAQERFDAQSRAHERVRELERETFELRRALGRATLADEVARQQALVEATVGGTRERLAAERALAEARRRLGEAEAAAGRAVLGFAEREFGGRAFTRAELEARFRQREREAEEIERRFALGGRVRAAELGRAFELGGLRAELAEVGLGVGEALGRGLAAALTPVREALGGLGAETLERLEAVLAAAAPDVARPLVAAYEDVFTEILAATDRFQAAFEARLREGTSRVGQALVATVYDELVGRLEREARRG